MRHIIPRTLTCLTLAGLLLIQLDLGIARSAEIDPMKHNELLMQCADRIEKWFALVTIQSQELDLEHVKIVRVGPRVVIPLKSAHGHVKAIGWLADQMEQALNIIRLLRERKIGAVNVLPFAHDPAQLYETRMSLLDELKGCEQKEQVQAVLGQCTDCEVREWLDIKP